jgi:hypothetical protein
VKLAVPPASTYSFQGSCLTDGELPEVDRARVSSIPSAPVNDPTAVHCGPFALAQHDTPFKSSEVTPDGTDAA